MKIFFYALREYDEQKYVEKFAGQYAFEYGFTSAYPSMDNVQLAKGYDGVCIFVNDTVNAEVIDSLHEMGVNIIALRCAGFNNVDMKHAFGKMHVVRVPAYSPYAVAEHTMALLLTSVRRIHKSYIRTRDFNFSLSGLTGFDLHGKTVGVVGTGRIGQDVIYSPVRIIVRIALGVSFGFFQFGVEEFWIIFSNRQFNSGGIVDKIISFFRIDFAANRVS